ncbi:MAG: hypothetical protein ABI461_02290, partial [Polyangiaceae bacterium]
EEMADALELLVAPADAARVAAWMRGLAGTSLDERAQLVTALATKSSLKLPLPLMGALVVLVVGIVSFAISSAHFRKNDRPIGEATISIPVVELAAPSVDATASTLPITPPVTTEIEIVDAPIPTPTTSAKSPRITKHARAPDCAEPYVVDAQGVRHYKKACLR